MAESRAAHRYAKALLDLAIEKGIVEQVHTDMQLLANTCEENRNLVNLLQSPIVSHYKKFAVLRDIFKSRVSVDSFSIFEIITKKNREEILFDVAKEFHSLYNDYKGVQVAEVITTFAVDDTLRSQFKQMVTKSTGKTNVELKEKVDTGLIGGFILQIGDRQIDESVKGKINRLKQQMSKA
ncbi:ATP synthase F1 subunit delta [Xanthocytophaga agilis]|uniref:ATP synthase subunit delta n=1 Tax=Xanthocytophaga agilis TaxID=3048010 RepID=A0AAE3RBL8_9BACT|nr:ATP synthase F1 subunit delta [Xanthocytophaga agilis]MDJ1505099.1 ATP synthase F1 subunit delta [Xanthocytophaga agilis]